VSVKYAVWPKRWTGEKRTEKKLTVTLVLGEKRTLKKYLKLYSVTVERIKKRYICTIAPRKERKHIGNTKEHIEMSLQYAEDVGRGLKKGNTQENATGNHQ